MGLPVSWLILRFVFGLKLTKVDIALIVIFRAITSMQNLIQSTKSITAQCILCAASFINSNRYVLNKLLNLIVLRKSRNFSQISFRSEKCCQSQLKFQELSAETFLLKLLAFPRAFSARLVHSNLNLGMKSCSSVCSICEVIS